MYRKQIEKLPTLHLIAERLLRYDELATEALADAQKATSDRAKNAHRNTALKFMKAFDSLALETGVIPKEPEKIYSAIEHIKPAAVAEKELPKRSKEEIAASILELLRYKRSM